MNNCGTGLSKANLQNRVLPYGDNQQPARIGMASKKIVILLVVCTLYSIMFSYLLSTNSFILNSSDHLKRWYATYKMVTEHRSLYDPQSGKEVVALNSIPVDPIEGSFFYPAYLIVFILPLVWLQYPLAHFIWLLIIQLLLIIGIFIMYRELKWPNSINQFTALLLLSVVFIPNIQNTIWGQFNTIAVISLALVYVNLLQKHYLLAGILTTGLTFKPQEMLLTVLFLLFWALVQRERWKLIIGFTLGMFALYSFAYMFEPNWVNHFIEGIRAYSALLHPKPVLNVPSNYQIVLTVVMISALVWLFVKNRFSMPSDLPFTGCIILSLSVWWLLVPVLGMMHLVALPVVAILLFAKLKQRNPMLYMYGIAGFLGLYGLGVIGFLYGLSSPSLYGLHIQLSELAYKTLMPIILTALALPLVLRGRIFIN